MNPETWKRLIIPLFVLLGLLVVNTITIANGVAQHQFWRVVFAALSDLGMIAVAIGVYINVKRNQKNQSPKG